jgi:histidinol dehydrogenase
MSAMLRIVRPAELSRLLADPVSPAVLPQAAEIVEDVRLHGDKALRAYAEKFGETQPGLEGLIHSKKSLAKAYASLPPRDQELLQRVAARIRGFAEQQRAAIREMTVSIPGGEAGHTLAPVEVAGCYAPGGRFPLPSTVLMTAVTARAAGVKTVIVASPKPTAVTLAAAHVADADALITAGGAHAIAAMAYGTATIPRVDIVVGPGNPWTTAAKKIVSGHVAIDMLAGPSELVVYADDSADPAMVAADLLAQAEHGEDSLPVLVTTSEKLIALVNREIAAQLTLLPTQRTAAAAIRHGYAVLVANQAEALSVIDALAPEHLELLCKDAAAIAPRVNHYGGLFIGAGAAEVLGDYGAGPNHTLPTGGTARFTGGLSVFNFLRIRTWMRIDDLSAARQLVEDARDLGRHEGLEGHSRSAEKRLLP